MSSNLSPVKGYLKQTSKHHKNSTVSQNSNESFPSNMSPELANRMAYRSIDRSEVSSMKNSLEYAQEDKAWLRYIQAVDQVVKMMSHKVMYLESKLVL